MEEITEISAYLIIEKIWKETFPELKMYIEGSKNGFYRFQHLMMGALTMK